MLSKNTKVKSKKTSFRPFANLDKLLKQNSAKQQPKKKLKSEVKQN